MTETIQAVDRALQILETTGRAGSISLAELSNMIRVNKASLSRLVRTLVQNGYLIKNETDGSYSLTLKAYEIGLNSVRNMNQLSLIHSALADLNKRTGGTAQFSVEDNDQLLCLQSVGTEAISFSLFTSVGRRSPLYSTGAGKALLSTYPSADLIEKWNHMHVVAVTEHTQTDLRLFLREMDVIRRRGYAVDREESEYHLYCVGTAIMDDTSQPIGAISVSTNRLTGQEEEETGSMVRAEGRRISRLLGYEGRPGGT